MHFSQFVWPLTQHSKVEFFPQTDPGSRMPIRALVTQQLNIKFSVLNVKLLMVSTAPDQDYSLVSRKKLYPVCLEGCSC